MAQTTNTLDLDSVDFFSQDTLVDPYELLKRFRKERPVAKIRQAAFERDQYIVTSYKLVDEVFRDNRRFSSHIMEVFTGKGSCSTESSIVDRGWREVDTLLTSDEPDHRRLRGLAAKAFMPQRIQRMAGLIGSTVTHLIDEFIERGECDFIREFAVPLPIHSIGEIMGIPSSHYEHLNRWTMALARRNGQLATPVEQIADAEQMTDFKEFVSELVSDRRNAPKDDLISDIVTADVDGKSPFTELEVLSTVLILIAGGTETTRSTLVSAMARLAQAREQVDKLRRDPNLIPKAIEEILRLDTPGTAIFRVAAQDTELGGVHISKGSILMLRLDSANRDEDVFREADKFDIDRPDLNRHLSFGLGIHFCIGHRLAREQSSQSLRQLLSRLNNLSVVTSKSDLRPYPSVIIRSLRALHLSFTPSRRVLEPA
jgi:cytochrome P450